MSACTFFGRSLCLNDITPVLYDTIENLINLHDVTQFYVGNQGDFDKKVRSVLKQLKNKYPDIDYDVVLAYVPVKKKRYDCMDYSDTLLPDGIELVHPRYAIYWRNMWMLKQSQYVVVYTTSQSGNSDKFLNIAEKQGKIIINIDK